VRDYRSPAIPRLLAPRSSRPPRVPRRPRTPSDSSLPSLPRRDANASAIESIAGRNSLPRTQKAERGRGRGRITFAESPKRRDSSRSSLAIAARIASKRGILADVLAGDSVRLGLDSRSRDRLAIADAIQRVESRVEVTRETVGSLWVRKRNYEKIVGLGSLSRVEPRRYRDDDTEVSIVSVASRHFHREMKILR